MKKLLFGALTFALIITSCVKDDLADLDKKIDELNAKITALATQVAGVATLQTNLTAVQAQLTALTTAVAALPGTASTDALSESLATLTANVAAIQTDLGTLAIDVAAGTVTADAAAVIIAELQASLATAQADIAQILQYSSLAIGVNANTGRLSANAYDNPDEGLTDGFADYLDAFLSVNKPLSSLTIWAYAGDPATEGVEKLELTGNFDNITAIDYSQSYRDSKENNPGEDWPIYTNAQLDVFFTALKTSTDPKVVITATDLGGYITTQTINLVGGN